jgi:hypothetical protein
MSDFRSVFLPYCLDRQPDGRYVVLNRKYKPVGFLTKDHIEYSDYPICVKFKGLGEITAAKISFNGDSNMDRIYLYNDGCIPTNSSEYMADYLRRLEILAKLAVD